MKTLYSTFLCFLFILIAFPSIGQSNIVRFETNKTDQLSYDLRNYLNENSKNKLIWFNGWHNGMEISDLPIEGTSNNLFLIPDNTNITNSNAEQLYYKKLKKVNKTLSKQYDLNLLTWPGCAGLQKINLNDQIVLLYIDTEWFFRPNTRAEYTNTKCETLWEIDFWASLEDLLEDENDKLVCIVGHHSIYQESKNDTKLSFLHPYNGPSRDFNSMIYTKLRSKMTNLLEANNNVIYISSNQAKKENQYSEKEIFLEDSGFIDFQTNKDGAIQITTKNGSTTTIYHKTEKNNPLVKIHIDAPYKRRGQSDSTMITGAEYKASWMKSFWLGGNFRDEWITPIKLNKLYLDDINGGIFPYAVGGGLQTLSLKFKDNDGRKFSFRSVNKDAMKNKERVIMQTAVGKVKQDMISSQLPFGDVVVGKLLDHTDILHVSPEPYIMSNQDELGHYKSAFKNVIGTLEEKPTKKTKKREGFANADGIVTTHYVLKQLLKNSKNQIDKQSFARCIMFDIWIADWDRHHDNWKWAEYESGKNRLYKPIPRDRDHAFALFEGVIGNLADVAAPNVAELSSNIKDLRGMTFQGKNMLYFLGASITREEWNEAATYIQSTFNKKKIDEAWNCLPTEIQDFSKEKIISRLVSRIDGLPKASDQLYDIFHKKAIFYGSNKHDEITINTVSNEEVVVSLYNSLSATAEKKLISQKTYKSDVTKQLEIYSIDGKDNITFTGKSESDIKIILLPGTDKDTILGTNTNTKIYDTQQYDHSESIQLTNPIYPDIYGYQYDALLPYLMYQFDSDYGGGFEVKLTKLSQKFNKKPFGKQTSFAAKYYPGGNSLRLRLISQYTDVWKKWDAKIKIRAANNDTRYDRLVGADVALPSNYLDNYRQDEIYFIQNENIGTYFSLVNNIYGQSDISFGVGGYFMNINEGTGELSKELIGGDKIWQTYVQSDINLDFTDSKSYPTKGIKYNVSNRLGYNLKTNTGVYNRFTADITLINSWHDISKSIIFLKFGGASIIGNKNYIDYPILGNGNNVRGFANNLIRNSNTAFINVELRKEVFRSKNQYIPFLLGVTGFYDRGFALGTSSNNVSGYGAGLYMTFLNNAYSLYINKGYNSLNDRSLISYGIGFSL